MYYVWVTLLLVINLISLGLTLIALPGNWAMVAAAALFVWLVPAADGASLSWTGVAIALGLAVIGEILELVAGAAGAARLGAAKRSLLLSMILTIAGSLVGSVAIPVPIVGALVGAVGGGAGGAWLGAVLGEASLGTDPERRDMIGRAAFRGRLLGTLCKLLVGVGIFVVVAVDLFT